LRNTPVLAPPYLSLGRGGIYDFSFFPSPFLFMLSQLKVMLLGYRVVSPLSRFPAGTEILREPSFFRLPSDLQFHPWDGLVFGPPPLLHTPPPSHPPLLELFFPVPSRQQFRGKAVKNSFPIPSFVWGPFFFPLSQIFPFDSCQILVLLTPFFVGTSRHHICGTCWLRLPSYSQKISKHGSPRCPFFFVAGPPALRPSFGAPSLRTTQHRSPPCRDPPFPPVSLSIFQ